MQPHRLVHLLATALVCLAAGLPARAAAPVPPEVVNPPELITADQIARLPPHPRLLADAARWTELRALVETSPAHHELHALLRRRADEILQAAPIDFAPKRPGENILAAIREAEDHILTLAMQYRLSGERAYLDGALAVMRRLAATSWPRGHFLDPATGCLSLAIGYDWLHDDIAPAERDAFAAKMRASAIDITLRDLDQHSFLWADFNWNQICNTGLTLGALALAERDPALARHLVNRAIALTPRAAGAYAPDGIYPEGPGYWAYGTSYHVILIEALRSSLGSSANLEKFPGFLASASVIDQLTGPSGDYFNYFDTRPGRTNQNLVFWFARETGFSDLADAELARVRRAAAQGERDYGRGLALALLWLPPPVSDSSAPRRTAPLHWQGGGHQPVASLRSAWRDASATWLALKGGNANYSHGHMDAGSFVLEAAGVRWAIDPVIEDYLVVRRRTGLTHAQFFNYGQDSARWDHFRLGPEGHNILRFDKARQRVNGRAALDPLRESAAGATVGLDLGSTYAGQAASVRREATLLPDGAVVIADSWTAPADRATAVTWQWLTAARATVAPDGVLLEQSGRTLRLGVTAPADARIELQPAATLMRDTHDGADPGWTRILIHMPTPAGATRQLRVTARAEAL